MTKLLMSAFVFAVCLSSATQAKAAWNNILRCDDGNVWVDVNSDARTNLQLVSRNSAANIYFNQTLEVHSSSYGGQNGTWETTWAGVQDAGVFSTADFKGATMTTDLTNRGYASLLLGEYVQGYIEYASFFRIDNNSLKLQITRRNLQKCVNNLYDGKRGRCSQGTYMVPYQYVGDRTFNNCQ